MIGAKPMNIISLVDEEGYFPRVSFDLSAMNRVGFDWLCIKTQSGNTSGFWITKRHLI